MDNPKSLIGVGDEFTSVGNIGGGTSCSMMKALAVVVDGGEVVHEPLAANEGIIAGGGTDFSNHGSKPILSSLPAERKFELKVFFQNGPKRSGNGI